MSEPMNVIYGLSCKCHPERGIQYVGQSSKGTRERFYHHVYNARNNKPWAVSRWMSKHGVENIEIRLLESFETPDELDDAEVKWIRELDTLLSSGGGYNLWPGGRSVRGYRHAPDAKTRNPRNHSEETRKKISEAISKNVGERSSAKKLSKGDVETILSRLWSGESASSISRDYPVGQGAILSISQGKTWPDVPRPTGPRLPSPTGRYKTGDQPGITKLTEDQVREIRRRYDLKEGCEIIAADFGITGGNVSMIGRRKTWKHVD